MFPLEADIGTVIEAIGIVVLVTNCIDDPGVGTVFATANTGPKTLGPTAPGGSCMLEAAVVTDGFSCFCTGGRGTAVKLAVVGMENKGADEAVAGTENNGSGGVL